MRRLLPSSITILFLGILVVLSGCGIFQGISGWIGGNGLLIERGAVVTCAGADGAMDILVKANGAILIPNSVLLALDPARKVVGPVCSRQEGITGHLNPEVMSAIHSLTNAKATALARMPPRSVGSFIDQLIDLILEGAPSKAKVDAARLAMIADLTLTTKRWDARIDALTLPPIP